MIAHRRFACGAVATLTPPLSSTRQACEEPDMRHLMLEHPTGQQKQSKEVLCTLRGVVSRSTAGAALHVLTGQHNAKLSEFMRCS
eukprot:6107748-Amphidinium_carterae.1